MDVVELLNKLNEYGPAGLFAAAFVSNLIPGFPALYLAFVGTYAAVVDDPARGALAIVAAGVGAGLGKVAVFLASRTLTGFSESLRRKREEARWLLDRAGSSLLILVFLFAALPLPDDVLYIPLGATGYKLASFAAAVIAGKIAQTALAYFLGRAYRSLFEKLFGVTPSGGVGVESGQLGLFIAGMFVGAVVVTAIIFLIDWRRVYEDYSSRGPLAGLKRLILEIVRILTFNRVRL